MGVDPGKKGAWAIVNDNGLLMDAASLDLDDLSGFANAIGRVSTVGLERAQPAKDQGHQFEYGRGFGRLEGVLFMAGVRVLLIGPAFWKSRMGVTFDKKETVQAALRIMPELSRYRNRAGNVPDGIAEAALIARALTVQGFVEDLATNAASRARAKARKSVSYRD